MNLVTGHTTPQANEYKGAQKMSSRTTRSRRTFSLESLEIRNAPSHIGGLAHAALALKVHAAAHVRHFSDSARHDRFSSIDKSSGVERTSDTNVETSSNDPSSIDKSPNDQSSIDRAGRS
jgi:hypothetical protein